MAGLQRRYHYNSRHDQEGIEPNGGRAAKYTMLEVQSNARHSSNTAISQTAETPPQSQERGQGQRGQGQASLNSLRKYQFS